MRDRRQVCRALATLCAEVDSPGEVRPDYPAGTAQRRLGSIRFDQRLRCTGIQVSGCPTCNNAVAGEVRLGYLQIVNPAYIARKGNMSVAYAFELATKNVHANVVKSTRPETYVGRRGRLRGNLIAIFHLMTGRLTPEYIFKRK